MDVVIPYQHSINNDLELKYALRSLYQYFHVDDVYIIGDIPRWPHRELIIIPFEQTRKEYHWRDRNIHEKIMVACSVKSISENFLVLHDDNFLLQPFYSFDYYYAAWPSPEDSGVYANVIHNTLKVLTRQARNFDVHCPHCFNKNLYRATVGQMDWRVEYGYCIKSSYANLCKIQGIYHEDLKFKIPWPTETIIEKLQGRAWFSIGDSAWKPSVTNIIKQLYQTPTKHEA